MKIEVKAFKNLSDYFDGKEEPISIAIFDNYKEADNFIDEEIEKKTGLHYYTKPIM